MATKAPASDRKSQRRIRPLLILLVLSIVLLIAAPNMSRSAQAGDRELQAGTPVTLEDFNDIVTTVDSGFNDFSGNMGVVNKDYLQDPDNPPPIVCTPQYDCHLDFQWDFDGATDGYTGMFLSLFGLTETETTFNPPLKETIAFPEHTLNLDDIDGALQEPDGPRQFEELCLRLRLTAAEGIQLRTEMKDATGGVRIKRLPVSNSPGLQDICWDFRTDYNKPGGSDLNLEEAKELALIIERAHVGDGIDNPVTGALEIHHIWFTMNTADPMPADDQALLDLVARRSYQYFLDWSSRKPESRWIPQDRSTFGDLLTVGGIGFGLPAHVIAAERGWIPRADAAQHVLDVLTVLDDAAAFGSEPVGQIGYRGWFYHFLGVDGRRKLNFDFETTPKDESLNTVELSSIDTSLALMGILAAQSYFDDSDDATEEEIRQLAQAIYDRVEWDFMLEPDARQFYLGWKPIEANEGPPFDIPDGDGLGHFSGTPTNPDTLDYYTDEALMMVLLAAGSDTHPVSADVYQHLIMEPDEGGLIRTWPGALFTYQFLPAFLDTRTALTACQSPNWHQNARQAIWRVIDYVEANPGSFSTYGPNAWGLSAAEGPYDKYKAYGAPPVAVNSMPDEDGTVTYYAMVSSVSFDDELRQRVIAALHEAWERDHWHARFGLPDAFHDQISEAIDEKEPPVDPIRIGGPWLNRALFAIDQGPMLLHLENARSGLIWRLLAKNPNIQRGLERIDPYQQQIILQGENGSSTSEVTVNIRSNALEKHTALRLDGQSLFFSFRSFPGNNGTLAVRYSNDNSGPSETVRLSLDGSEVGQFTAADTGNSGSGWNEFVTSDPINIDSLEAGQHTLQLSVAGGDGHGIEIDAVIVRYQTDRCLLYLPYTAAAP